MSDQLIHNTGPLLSADITDTNTNHFLRNGYLMLLSDYLVRSFTVFMKLRACGREFDKFYVAINHDFIRALPTMTITAAVAYGEEIYEHKQDGKILKFVMRVMINCMYAKLEYMLEDFKTAAPHLVFELDDFGIALLRCDMGSVCTQTEAQTQPQDSDNAVLDSIPTLSLCDELASGCSLQEDQIALSPQQTQSPQPMLCAEDAVSSLNSDSSLELSEFVEIHTYPPEYSSSGDE